MTSLATTAAGPPPAAVVPAQVGFLAIFNPSLGNTDDTLDDQIVYYSSLDAQSLKRRRHRRARPTENVSQAERNERLRQIGLAQGMVNFAKSFSGDQSVDTIETEKTRVVLHELEPGWWVLACIDLTRLPLPPTTPRSKDASSSTERKYEYSSREVKPSCLLLQDLLRAHSTFLLHHDSSLSALFLRTKRERFTGALGRYWDLYLSTWNVLLHGNPVRNIFRGIKIAASGELGIGVGEEERGSGEREVLEGFVGRTEGLVDLVVSKFGHSDPDESSKAGGKSKEGGQNPDWQWLGTAKEPSAEDGAIFLGVGALSRKSIRDITHWMEDIYTWGENAYGVLDSPKANRRLRRESRRPEEQHSTKFTAAQPMHVPPSLIPQRRGSKAAGKTPSPQANKGSPDPGTIQEAPDTTQEYAGGIDKYMEYLKLGYGKYWSFGGDPASKDETGNAPPPERRNSRGEDSVGHFLIGLTGEVEEGWVADPEERRFSDNSEQQDVNSRKMVRTVTVELETEATEKTESQISTSFGSQDTELSNRRASMASKRASFDSQDRNKTAKLRVVVYVVRPFIFTFLFELRTESLEFEGLYRSLHHQIAPLRKSLSLSTAYRPEKPDVGTAAAAVYDLVWDPKEITIHSGIPNIPDATEVYNGDGGQPPWSRVEALNTHMQILNVYNAARADPSELERTCKTSRGWWIVWNRIVETRAAVAASSDRTSSENGSSGSSSSSSSSSVKNDLESDELVASSSAASTIKEIRQVSVSKEILLLRKASDHAGHGRSVSLTAVATGSGWADGASRLAQGIGFDTRKYIEGLLSLHG